MRRRSAAVLLGGHLDPQLTMTLCSLPFWQLAERQEVERGGQGEKIWIQIFFSFFLFFFWGGGGVGGKNLDPSVQGGKNLGKTRVGKTLRGGKNLDLPDSSQTQW